ncbi:IS5 family transposase IS112 [Streptomyces sp. enrichment culture]
MPTRDHTIAEQSKNHRYSTNHQMVIDTDTRQAAAGRPLPGNRNDCQAWNQSGTEAAADDTTTITDSSHASTRPATPHHRRTGEELLDWQQAHNKSRKQVRARVEHAFARMKT